MENTENRKEAKVLVNIVDFVFDGRKYMANIFTTDSIEVTESVEGKTLKECLLNLRTKLDEMKIEYQDTYVYAEWNSEELSEEDERIWETRLQDLE